MTARLPSMNTETKHLMGYGIWRLETGFYAVDGWCNNIAHADIRSDLEAIKTLRAGRTSLKGSRLIRIYNSPGNKMTMHGPKGRQWDLVEENMVMTG